jgi:hypothetical protein
VLPADLPIKAPTMPPVPAPIAAPFCVLFRVRQPETMTTKERKYKAMTLILTIFYKNDKAGATRPNYRSTAHFYRAFIFLKSIFITKRKVKTQSSASF